MTFGDYPSTLPSSPFRSKLWFVMLDLFPQTEMAFLFPLPLQTHLHLVMKQETAPSHLQESVNQEKTPQCLIQKLSIASPDSQVSKSPDSTKVM